MRVFVLITLLLHLLNAYTLDEIISNALKNNPSLEVINNKISANSFAINSSATLSNPEILFTTNTLDSAQPMSQSIITLKQKIPYISKLTNKKDISQAQQKILFTSLEKAKSALVYSIKKTAYMIWELEEIYKTLVSNEKLIKKSIKLFESYTSINNNQHIDMMDAELSLIELKVKKSELKSKIDSAYTLLSYLSAEDIKNIDISLDIDVLASKISLQEQLVNNLDIELKNKEIQKQNATVQLSSANRFPDLMLSGGYSVRSEFDNYFNIGVGITLPIYGVESSKLQEQKKLLLSQEAQKKDLQTDIQNKFQNYYIGMKSSYEIYKIIKDEALAQIQHMLDISYSSVSTGTNLLKQIKILQKKLQLEQKSINAVSSYHTNYAKILQLSGAIK